MPDFLKPLLRTNRPSLSIGENNIKTKKRVRFIENNNIKYKTKMRVRDSLKQVRNEQHQCECIPLWILSCF